LNRIRVSDFTGEPSVLVWVWEARWAVRIFFYVMPASLWRAAYGRGCGDRIIAFRPFRAVYMKCHYLHLSWIHLQFCY